MVIAWNLFLLVSLKMFFELHYCQLFESYPWFHFWWKLILSLKRSCCSLVHFVVSLALWLIFKPLNLLFILFINLLILWSLIFNRLLIVQLSRQVKQLIVLLIFLIYYVTFQILWSSKLLLNFFIFNVNLLCLSSLHDFHFNHLVIFHC